MGPPPLNIKLCDSALGSVLEREIAENWQYNWGIIITYMRSQSNKRLSYELSNQKISYIFFILNNN